MLSPLPPISHCYNTEGSIWTTTQSVHLSKQNHRVKQRHMIKTIQYIGKLHALSAPSESSLSLLLLSLSLLLLPPLLLPLSEELSLSSSLSPSSSSSLDSTLCIAWPASPLSWTSRPPSLASCSPETSLCSSTCCTWPCLSWVPVLPACLPARCASLSPLPSVPSARCVWCCVRLCTRCCCRLAESLAAADCRCADPNAAAVS